MVIENDWRCQCLGFVFSEFLYLISLCCNFKIEGLKLERVRYKLRICVCTFSPNTCCIVVWYGHFQKANSICNLFNMNYTMQKQLLATVSRDITSPFLTWLRSDLRVLVIRVSSEIMSPCWPDRVVIWQQNEGVFIMSQSLQVWILRVHLFI